MSILWPWVLSIALRTFCDRVTGDYADSSWLLYRYLDRLGGNHLTDVHSREHAHRVIGSSELVDTLRKF